MNTRTCFDSLIFWNIITPQGPRLCRRDLHHNDLFPTTTTMVLIIMVWVSIGKIFWLIAPLDPTLEGSLHWSIWRGAYGGYSCIGLVTFNFSGGVGIRPDLEQNKLRLRCSTTYHNLTFPEGGEVQNFFFPFFQTPQKVGLKEWSWKQ